MVGGGRERKMLGSAQPLGSALPHHSLFLEPGAGFSHYYAFHVEAATYMLRNVLHCELLSARRRKLTLITN